MIKFAFLRNANLAAVHSYELRFKTAAYCARHGVALSEPPFLDVIASGACSLNYVVANAGLEMAGFRGVAQRWHGLGASRQRVPAPGPKDTT